eukprot:1381882-Amorphochlora_amoeboformis.AAC.1
MMNLDSLGQRWSNIKRNVQRTPYYSSEIRATSKTASINKLLNPNPTRTLPISSRRMNASDEYEHK